VLINMAKCTHKYVSANDRAPDCRNMPQIDNQQMKLVPGEECATISNADLQHLLEKSFSQFSRTLKARCIHN